MKFSPEQADVLNHILRWRRDVRNFLTDAVPEPVIDRLRAAMDMSPSVGNSRPWRVLRVEDPERRVRVQAIFEGCNLDAAAGFDDVTRSEYVRLKLAGLRDAPLHRSPNAGWPEAAMAMVLNVALSGPRSVT